MATSTVQAERTLLWTNPSPTADFGAQTISLDLSNYDHIELEYARQAQYQGIYDVVRMYIGISSYIFCSSGGNNARQIQTTTTGVQFSNGIYYGSYGGGAASQNNAVVIPIRIYGIK